MSMISHRWSLLISCATVSDKSHGFAQSTLSNCENLIASEQTLHQNKWTEKNKKKMIMLKSQVNKNEKIQTRTETFSVTQNRVD